MSSDAVVADEAASARVVVVVMGMGMDMDMDMDLHVEVDTSPLQEKEDTVVTPPPPQPYSRFQEVDRTIAISVFPAGPIGLTAFDKHNVIAPCSHEDDASLLDLVRIATQATSRDELTHIYQLGYQAAERWCRQELELELEHRK
jgi:hypothetical protein